VIVEKKKDEKFKDEKFYERLNEIEAQLDFKDPILKEKLTRSFKRLRGPEGMLGLSNLGLVSSIEDLTSTAIDSLVIGDTNYFAERVINSLEQGVVIFKNEGEAASLFYIQKKLGHEQVRWRPMFYIIAFILIIFGIGAYFFHQ
jgi:hypothetical protein